MHLIRFSGSWSKNKCLTVYQSVLNIITQTVFDEDSVHSFKDKDAFFFVFFFDLVALLQI